MLFNSSRAQPTHKQRYHAKAKTSSRALTLVELMVAIALSMALFGILMTGTVWFTRSWERSAYTATLDREWAYFSRTLKDDLWLVDAADLKTMRLSQAPFDWAWTVHNVEGQATHFHYYFNDHEEKNNVLREVQISHGILEKINVLTDVQAISVEQEGSLFHVTVIMKDGTNRQIYCLSS